MNIVDRMIAAVSPEAAFNRARFRQALAHYDAAGAGTRTKHWRRDGTDADAASAQRSRLAFSVRDLVRNTAFAERGTSVIAAAVVGEGIGAKVSKGGTEAVRRRMAAHLSTRDIDADGRNNLAGIQNLIMRAVVSDGEVLVRRRRRRAADGFRFPLQIQVMEVDYIDQSRTGDLENGSYIRDGIEYNSIGQRVAYYMFRQHPGSAGTWRSMASYRVDASEILHIYRMDRPGQMRGVSWFAPVALEMKDLHEYQEAQIVKQRTSACFAAFRRVPEDARDLDASQVVPETLRPGMIAALGPGESIDFANPPTVTGYDDFMRRVLHSIASGIGVTYQALSGDLSNTSWTSYRAGAIHMDRNVTCWQRQIMIAQFCEPLGRWLSLAATGDESKLQIEWTPPRRPMLDPSKEIPAQVKAIEAGLASRQGTIRANGGDPDQVAREHVEDAAMDVDNGFRFTTSVFEEEASTEGEQNDE